MNELLRELYQFRQLTLLVDAKTYTACIHFVGDKHRICTGKEGGTDISNVYTGPLELELVKLSRCT